MTEGAGMAKRCGDGMSSLSSSGLTGGSLGKKRRYFGVKMWGFLHMLWYNPTGGGIYEIRSYN